MKGERSITREQDRWAERDWEIGREFREQRKDCWKLSIERKQAPTDVPDFLRSSGFSEVLSAWK